MPHTDDEVILRALQDIRVTPVGGTALGSDSAYAQQAFDALVAELAIYMTFDFAFDVDIPESHFLPLAWLLANRLPAYNRPPPVAWNTALMRLRAANNPYVRDMDLNEDATTSEDEIEAFDRGAFF